MTGYLSNSSYCCRCRARCRPPPPPFFLAMVTNPRDCSLLQHLPDYNTWVEFSRKPPCCGAFHRPDERRLSRQNGGHPSLASVVKFLQFHVVVELVRGGLNEDLEAPTSLALVSRLKGGPVAVL